MSSLGVRGGASIMNRIFTSAAATTDDCPFSVMAYKDTSGNGYKALVEAGEVNYKLLDGAEISISPPCEIAIYVQYNTKAYRYKQPTLSIASTFDASDTTAYASQATDDGNGGFDVSMYIPLAWIDLDNGEPFVRQYFCGNVDFTWYYVVVNGTPYIQTFKTWDLAPAEVFMNTTP